jgi:hypothetical protein
MTALTMPSRRAHDANLRPVPWVRMAWVTWRQHRIALAGVAMLLCALALYLWLAGNRVQHAYVAATACHPASSLACQNMIFSFEDTYVPAARNIAALLQMVPALIGAFVGAPVLARELETGTSRYAWTLPFGRWRWTLAKLVPLAVVVTAAAGVFSLMFSWYYQPIFAAGGQIPLDPNLFNLRGIAFAAWTLAAFAVGALAGMLIRRVVPAIAATLAVYAGLALTVGQYLRQHYLTPLLTTNVAHSPAAAAGPPGTAGSADLPSSTWMLSQWWTKDGRTLNQHTMSQVLDSTNRQIAPTLNSREQKPQATLDVLQYLTHHGYTQWTRYQPGSRFWPFQWIEGGWLLALSALLITATVWLIRRRAT